MILLEKRPYTKVILAMTADGKIADFQRNSAQFGSSIDKAYLEHQISLVDGVLFGAGTLRAYGTTLPLKNPDLLANRKQQNKPPQPVQIVCSASGNINPNLCFFSQPIPRWLLTTEKGETTWKNTHSPGFEKLIIAETSKPAKIQWTKAFQHLKKWGLNNLAILGGGELVASLLEDNLIDELCLTICPLILGGATSPTPVEGMGFLSHQAKQLELLRVEKIGQEIFLHYRLHP